MNRLLRKSHGLLALLAFLILLPATVQADEGEVTILLRSGEKVTGTLVDFQTRTYRVRVDGKVRTIPEKEVARITFDQRAETPSNWPPRLTHFPLVEGSEWVFEVDIERTDISNRVPPMWRVWSLQTTGNAPKEIAVDVGPRRGHRQLAERRDIEAENDFLAIETNDSFQVLLLPLDGDGSPGEWTWTPRIGWSATARIVDRKATVETPAGTFENCLEVKVAMAFGRTDPDEAQIKQTWFLAPEVGPVRIHTRKKQRGGGTYTEKALLRRSTLLGAEPVEELPMDLNPETPLHDWDVAAVQSLGPGDPEEAGKPLLWIDLAGGFNELRIAVHSYNTDKPLAGATVRIGDRTWKTGPDGRLTLSGQELAAFGRSFDITFDHPDHQSRTYGLMPK